MKFAHLSDVHIGAWRDPAMKDLNLQAFIRALDIITAERCDFVLIVGDLFNTALPSVDQVKEAIRQIKRLATRGIPVYYIAGSHDYSPSGKTLLDILEEAELATNVSKGTVEGETLKLSFTIDPKTKVKLTGIPGMKGMLDKHYYAALDRASLENEPGDKIFLFHTSITELKPEDMAQMESWSVTAFPPGCKYYAGGHVHIRKSISIPGYPHVVYPGPTFPCSFSELEKLKHGSFIIVEDWKPRSIAVPIKEVVCHTFDADGKTPADVAQEMESWLRNTKVQDAIVLIRAEGMLTQGSGADLPMPELIRLAEERGAFHVLRNTAKLASETLDEVQSGIMDAREIEDKVLKEHAGQITVTWHEEAVAKELMTTLGQTQNEGEKANDYERRLLEEARLAFK